MTRNVINTGQDSYAPGGGTRRALLGIAGTAFAAATGRAQRLAWPTQPIRFIGIFPPSGGTDILSRIWCKRPLAVTGATRSPQAPEVPAMAEFLDGYEINSWGGVLGPAGIPPTIVERIAEVGREAVESAEVRRRFEEAGATVWWTPPTGLAEFRRENEARFAPLVRASGARVK